MVWPRERTGPFLTWFAQGSRASKRMPNEFCAEVVQCAIYVHNRCPHVKLDDQTPQEAWSGQKPTISHLKVFGSVAYAHVLDQRRTQKVYLYWI